jgi:protein-arginine kinase activator protein McsA
MVKKITAAHRKTILSVLSKIHNKRAELVIKQILKKGFITTEDLENAGYNHPPRAARDVREAGVPLETFRVKASNGKSIAAYRFGNLNNIESGRLEGRMILPKKLKTQLYEQQKGKCYICNNPYPERYLQIDHRVPYEVGGDSNKEIDPADYGLICGSCNRAKSWSCEHCDNEIKYKDPKICANCYWANPNDYKHIAMTPIRRVDLVWEGKEVEDFEDLNNTAKSKDEDVRSYIKNLLKKKVEK